MKKQTAVEWLVEELQKADYIPKDSSIMNFVIGIAKEKQKENIIETARYYFHERGKLTPQKYYKETFESEQVKQETLEEVAERLYPILLEEDGWDKNKQYRDEWIECACWQAERMYSEEDMKEAFKAGQDYENFDCRYAFNEWFKQFKKN